MMGNFACFSVVNIFFRKILSGILSDCQTIWIQIEALHVVGPDMRPNCLQSVSAEDTSRQKDKPYQHCKLYTITCLTSLLKTCFSYFPYKIFYFCLKCHIWDCHSLNAPSKGSSKKSEFLQKNKLQYPSNGYCSLFFLHKVWFFMSEIRPYNLEPNVIIRLLSRI